MLHQSQLEFFTQERGTIEITRAIDGVLQVSQLEAGLCNLFVKHTSASLIVSENADPLVRTDLEAWLSRAVPDGDSIFQHTAEGPDDMPAHVRSALTSSSISVPVLDGRLDLGTWQGIYLYEHRISGSRRLVSLTFFGD